MTPEEIQAELAKCEELAGTLDHRAQWIGRYATSLRELLALIAERDQLRAERDAAVAKLDFLKSKGLTVGMAKDAGRPEYMTYVIEDGSCFDDGELIAESALHYRETVKLQAQLRTAREAQAKVAEVLKLGTVVVHDESDGDAILSVRFSDRESAMKLLNVLESLPPAP